MRGVYACTRVKRAQRPKTKVRGACVCAVCTGTTIKRTTAFRIKECQSFQRSVCVVVRCVSLRASSRVHVASQCPVPDVGCYSEVSGIDWKVYRLAEDVMVIADRLAQTSPKGRWGRFIASAHGVLLRRLRKQRVIYLLRTRASRDRSEKPIWHSNINLVTGLSQSWLNDDFEPTRCRDFCVIAGLPR